MTMGVKTRKRLNNAAINLLAVRQGRYREALDAWQQAAREHHPHGSALFPYVQKSLDKLGRYSEIGLYPSVEDQPATTSH